MIRNESGQVIAEFSITTLLITLPLILGGFAWFKWEFNKASAAYQSFAHARAEMIQTGQVTDFPVHIGGMSEDVKLYPLESLDQSKGGLGVSDLGNEASQLLADASRFYRRLQELASTISSKESTTLPKLKSPSIDVPESSSSN